MAAAPYFIVRNLTRNTTVASSIRSAHRSSERRRGLLGVTHLDEGAGLWIDPCEAVHTFFMKISLDVFFLDRQHRVRKIAAHLGPNRIAFCLSAHCVLELCSGAAAVSETQRGDQLQLIPTAPAIQEDLAAVDEEF